MNYLGLRKMRSLWAVLILASSSWLSAEAQIQVGYATLRPDVGTAAPAGAALFSYSNAAGTGVSEAGGHASAVLPHIALGGGFRTQILLVNTGPQTTRGYITFVAPDGRPLPVRLGTSTIVDLRYEIPPSGSYSPELDGPLETTLSGYAVV